MIVQQLSGAIAQGDLDLGEKLPSVGNLAQGMRATPNTVVHAYQKLDREGRIGPRHGQGTFTRCQRPLIRSFGRSFPKSSQLSYLSKCNE